VDTLLEIKRGAVVLGGHSVDVFLSGKHYAAFVLVGLSYLTFFFFFKGYQYIIGATILSGLFNLINFAPLESTVGIAINSFSIRAQPESLLAGVLFIMVNKKQLLAFFKGKKSDASSNKPESARQFATIQENVAQFRVKYENYSTESLTEIVSAGRYVPEALEAARQVLEERGQNTNESPNVD
jgi:hypothetical protein